MKECNQCGKCCTKYGADNLYVTANEIEMWELFAPDIAQYVQNGKVWFDPKTAEPLSACPFLKVIDPSSNSPKYTCDIYLERPDDCRQYPSLVSEMIRDGCEMIEAIDINSPSAAQKRLEKLMQDSR